jgi:hypothetical protein
MEPSLTTNCASQSIIIIKKSVKRCCNFRRQNVIKKEGEKISKYKDLTTEIQHMWNVKTEVIPAITGATVIILKSFRKYLNNIPGQHDIKELQKTATLATGHILCKVLM